MDSQNVLQNTTDSGQNISAIQSAEGMGIVFGTVPQDPTQIAIDGIRFDFNDGIRVKIPKDSKSYRIRFVDLDNKFTIYDAVTPPTVGGTAISTKKYFINSRIIISDSVTDKLLFSHDYNAKGKDVVIRFPVHTLGDSIAWFSYAERFQKKHGCNLFCAVSPWFAEIVRKQYPEIHFITREEAEKISSYANYNIGLYEIGNSSHQVFDHRYVGLHKVAAYMLGVDLEEKPPRFNLSAKRKIKEKYVCIAVQSTSLAKMWNHPLGWRRVVEHLKKRGYRVLCIDREAFTGKNGTYTYPPPNVEDFTGNRPLQERIDLIKDADFFVGLSSGLSWLAWGCLVPVVLISGFSAPWNEFYTPYRVFNPNVCHCCNGCWNEFRDFDLKNFWYCPRHGGTDRAFECTGLIPPDKVIETIKKLISDLEKRK